MENSKIVFNAELKLAKFFDCPIDNISSTVVKLVDSLGIKYDRLVIFDSKIECYLNEKTTTITLNNSKIVVEYDDSKLPEEYIYNNGDILVVKRHVSFDNVSITYYSTEFKESEIIIKYPGESKTITLFIPRNKSRFNLINLEFEEYIKNSTAHELTLSGKDNILRRRCSKKMKIFDSISMEIVDSCSDVVFHFDDINTVNTELSNVFDTTPYAAREKFLILLKKIRKDVKHITNNSLNERYYLNDTSSVRFYKTSNNYILQIRDPLYGKHVYLYSPNDDKLRFCSYEFWNWLTNIEIWQSNPEFEQKYRIDFAIHGADFQTRLTFPADTPLFDVDNYINEFLMDIAYKWKRVSREEGRKILLKELKQKYGEDTICNIENL